MSECGYSIERGSYVLGPCRLEVGHEGRHDKYAPGELEREFEARFGMSPFAYPAQPKSDCPDDPQGHNTRDGRHCEACGKDLLA